MITEADRFELHRELREKLGNDVADTLMEHLPHGGWSANVRTHNVDLLEHRIRGLESRVDRLDRRTSHSRGRIADVSISSGDEAKDSNWPLRVSKVCLVIAAAALVAMMIRLQFAIASL